VDCFEVDLSGSRLEKIGDEGVKIVKVSRFFDDANAVIATAATHKYTRINPHYPGVRAPVETELLNKLSASVAQLASDHFRQPVKPWIGQAWYSIVTAQRSKLAPIQRLPHFDGFDENQFAIMIYVNRTAHGGTAFYRQRDTGFETVTEKRFPTYKAKLEADVQAHGLPPAEYISDGAPYFEKITDLGADFNSLILYPGIALHSGVIDNSQPLHASPMEGRLTINGFFKPT